MKKARRPIWLWAFALWVLGLAVIGLGRGTVLWREHTLLFQLGSSLSPVTLTLFVLLFTLCGSSLATSALAIWWRRDWARQATRVEVPLYFAIDQAYTWLFVRSGLMWERRWISLALALLAVSISTGALSWHRPRKWLGLQ